MQDSLKLGGNNYHFKWVIVPGTSSLIERPEISMLSIQKMLIK